MATIGEHIQCMSYMSWWGWCLASQDVNIGELVAFKLSIGQTIFSLATALDASRLKMLICDLGSFDPPCRPWLIWVKFSVFSWWVAGCLPDNILSLRWMPQDSRCQFGDLCTGPQAALHLAGPWVTSRSSSATCFPGFEQSGERGNQACFTLYLY